MDTSLPLIRTRCYQRAARLMARGVSLSVALRGCLPIPGGHPLPTNKPAGTQGATESAQGPPAGR